MDPDKKSPRGGLPKIEHFRKEIPGKPGGGLVRIVVEERGIRDFMRKDYEDHNLTVASIVWNSPTSVEIYESMLLRARMQLKEAGEKDFLDVTSFVDQAIDEGGKIRALMKASG